MCPLAHWGGVWLTQTTRCKSGPKLVCQAQDLSARGTESQVTQLPGLSWVQSHPAPPLAEPGDLGSIPGIFYRVQTGWPLLPWGVEARCPGCQEGSPTPAQQARSSKGLSLDFSAVLKSRAVSEVTTQAPPSRTSHLVKAHRRVRLG